MSTLSRLYLNPGKRGARKLLTSPEAMHAAVRAAFPPDIDTSGARVLWRVDKAQDVYTLYVQGPEPPDLEHLVEQAGWSTRPGNTADLLPFLDSLRRGQEWAFRLVANPVKSLSRGPKIRGKVVPHVTPAQQVQWLQERAEHSGFEFRTRTSGEPDVAVTQREDLSFAKREGSEREQSRSARRRISLRTARFDGSLRVTDVEELRQALAQGIGRGKAYGCGLLSLARLSREDERSGR